WQDPLILTTTGCPSVPGFPPAVARYMITTDGGDNLSRCDTGTPATDPGLLRCGSMTESPPESGIYEAVLEPLAPAHGLVKVTMGLTCPDLDPDDGVPPESGQSSFDLYIDPSGWVQTVHGTPLRGALVTLYRSESAFGPFEVVPDGSALMSPKNRTNPDHTDSAGHFGWDTIAGYYVVRAEYPGCVAPGDPLRTYVETDILPVPPEWLDLHLYLDCGGIAPPHLSLPTQILADAATTAGAVVSYEVSAVDDLDGPVPVTCSSPSGGLFAVGTTTVTCSARNAVGNEASGSFAVKVTYAWSNVLAPLRPGSGNRLQRGRTVPVKFALTGASTGIADLAAHLYVAAVISGVPGPEVPARSAGNAPGNASFRYDASADAYIFNWSTEGLPGGHYQLRIDLGDGASRTVPVELR
ncbi:MAG TPA: PxKF domain-containing protein, partial [Kofleriaceae bacterium]|nr:PxKF domain-containing protein [Kofleriaceae bacterium]